MARRLATELDYDEVAPEPSALIESMRAYGYTLATAIADLVDNSIAADCTNVWMRFEWAGADSWISITDDGRGMTEADLRNAMRLGSMSPVEDRDLTDLGRFGLGLKTASFSQCRRLTVASRTKPGQASVRRWDLDHLASRNVSGWQLLKTPYDGSKNRALVPAELQHGTAVLWEVLDREIGDVGKDDKRAHDHFLGLIESVEEHLSMVFHRYVGGPGQHLRIHINDKEISPWDPFLANHPATQTTSEEKIAFPGHEVPIKVRGFVLPHKDKLGDEAHKKASGPAGWNAQQGFYLYRSRRLILPGSWLGLGGSRPWTKEEHYKLARIRLDIPNSMDHLWHLDVKKSSAQPPPNVRNRLKGLAQSVRQEARSVFAYRGKYRQRTSKQELRRPWKIVRRAGVRSYKIDREHPLIEAVMTTNSTETRKQLEAALRVIEETVPVEQIWLDTAEKPDELVLPFHGSTAKQIRSLIEIAYQAIRRNKTLSHAETLEFLLSSEEFANEEAKAIIESLSPGGPP